MKLFTVSGTYGSNNTPCDVFCATMPNGSTWYACENSVNVNCTCEDIADGVNVEELSDFDMFTWPEGIDSLDILEKAIDA